MTDAALTTTSAAPEQRGRSAQDDELRDRRPGDVARVVAGALGAVLAGLWAMSSADVDSNLFKVVNGLPNALHGVATFFDALGSIWFAAAVVLLVLLLRRLGVARDAALAAGAGWLVASGLNDVLGTRSAHSLGIHVRTGSGPSFPSATVTVAMALAVALAPYMIRPLRRSAWAIVPLVGLSAMYLGSGLASDVVGGLLIGLAAGAAVHVAFGAPGGRPSAGELRRALEDLGFDAVDVEPDRLHVPRATVMDFSTGTGARCRVTAFGRDQRDGQFAAKAWHALMYKAPGLPVFGSRLQQVEHVAYALMIAERGGARVPSVLKTGIAGPDAALLVTDVPGGRSFAERVDELDAGVLAEVWAQLQRLHRAGVAHGALGPDRLLVDDDGQVSFADLGTAEVGAAPYWRDRDVAAVLVLTALRTGNERAIEAATEALGPEPLAAALPLIQPAALPAGAGRGVKHFGKVLKQLRADVATATGAQDIAPLKVRRLSLVNVGMLAGIILALAVAVPGLAGVNWSSVGDEFANATWSWVVLAAFLYPLVPIAWATALMGCVNADLPFVPTVLTQVACSFLNLITPNGIGGTALQLDYLRHEGVPVASGGSAMVLSTGVGGLIQLVLFLIAVALTATKIDTKGSGGGASLGAIALVAAAIGVVLLVPKVRGKVVPAVRRAASDIWAVLRNPRKAAQLFGGDLAGNLVYPALLGICLLAFGHSLSFAQLIVVQVGAGMLGNVAPVPGGIGVQEAALTAGLTSFGIPNNPALATVIVFRTVTFVLPPVVGFFTLHWLRRTGHA